MIEGGKKKSAQQNKNNNNNSTEVLSNTQKKFIEHTRNMNMNLNVSQCCFSAQSSQLRDIYFYSFVLFFSREYVYVLALNRVTYKLFFFLFLFSFFLYRESRKRSS